MTLFHFGTNLKMHQTPQHTREYILALRERVALLPDGERVRLWVTPPFTSLEAAAQAARSSRIAIGGQNMHWADEGPHTGEIAPPMLKACGATFVLLGHAERRTQFGETDEALNRKVQAAARHGLDVMLCVGEPIELKQANAGREFVAQQLKLDLAGYAQPERLQVLYEPIWSVGSKGVAADPAYVAAAFGHIRRVLVELFGIAGERVPILYGGSVDAVNCVHYAVLPELAGMGVGRAGLSPHSFMQVLTNALSAWLAIRR